MVALALPRDPVAEFWSGGQGEVEAGEVAGTASVEGMAGPPGVDVAGETLIFLGNSARCPLTDHAVPLGGARVLVTDIYLPRWFAHNLPAIHTPLLLGGKRSAHDERGLLVVMASEDLLVMGSLSGVNSRWRVVPCSPCTA